MRQIVSAKTIEEWEALDPQTQSVILNNIKLKNRLETWMKGQINRPALLEPIQKTCYRCEGTGTTTHYPRMPGIHPSQVAHSCMLRIYNQMIGKQGEERFDFRSQLIFNLGSQIHLMFQGYGRKGAWGPHYKDEVRITEELQDIAYDLFLEGSADAENILIIDDIPDAPIYEVGIIHEYKSININGFEKLAGPKPEHKLQALIYSKALNRPIVCYMYMNKNDCTIADYPVGFSASAWKSLEEKLVRLNQFYNSGQPPPGTRAYHCRDCEFYKDCPDGK